MPFVKVPGCAWCLGNEKLGRKSPRNTRKSKSLCRMRVLRGGSIEILMPGFAREKFGTRNSPCRNEKFDTRNSDTKIMRRAGFMPGCAPREIRGPYAGCALCVWTPSTSLCRAWRARNSEREILMPGLCRVARQNMRNDEFGISCFVCCVMFRFSC